MNSFITRTKASKELRIKLKDPKEKSTVTINDFSGAMIRKVSVRSESDAIDVADLAEGWYIITIRDTKGSLKREKIYIKRYATY